MVYRLWARVRMVDAIAWQEASANPAASGFRLARSALNGAAMTQVLTEPCRLRGWDVAEMSIDYVKCFHLIPDAVLLALALELGMDPRTCRALEPCTSSSSGPSRSKGPLACGGRPPTASSRHAPCRSSW